MRRVILGLLLGTALVAPALAQQFPSPTFQDATIRGSILGFLTLASGISVGGSGTVNGHFMVNGNTDLKSTMVTGSLETTGTATFVGLTVTTNGAAITGNSIVNGTFTSTGKLFVQANGASIVGNTSVLGTLSGLTGLSVVSGGASIVGDSTITGNTTVTGPATITGLLSTAAFSPAGNITSTGGVNTFSGVTTLTSGSVTNPGTSGNQLVNFSQFNPTLAASGFIKFPGGLKEAWGSCTTDIGGMCSVGYPTTFGSIFSVSVQPITSSSIIATVPAVTSTALSILTTLGSTGDGTAATVFWKVIGD